ncbi:MAG: chromosome segregation protein SMC [Desulfuromonadaceae bacterium]|nr:chromosome segregation protein SMC [Desulfuromonadaceae bacterium]
MKIRRIEIIGFKSFVERTVLTFDDGITAILGPNGCGKSNVVDAIRWVMGEQNAKHLRGQAMEDVIFNGSEGRRAFGMAEVSLVFVNADDIRHPLIRDYSEVMVTRRLYRNGDSEYQINKTPCRLKDITELFMDTGVGARAYSIIEQGKIGAILHAPPEERRVLLEEAAGITKYKVRKKAAERKIEATQANLLRLDDIVGEVRRQLDSLERQARRAERFRSLRLRLKTLDVQLAGKQWRELSAALALLQQQEQQLRDSLALAEARERQMVLELEALQLRKVEQQETSAASQRQLLHARSEIQTCENRLTLVEQQRGRIQLQQEELQDEARRLQQACQQSCEQLGILEEQQRQAAEQARQAYEVWQQGQAGLTADSALEKQLADEVARSRKAAQEHQAERSRCQGERERVRQQLNSLGEQLTRYQQEAQGLAEQKSKLELVQAELERTLLEAKRTMAAGVEQLQRLEREVEPCQQALNRQVEADKKSQAELNLCQSRLQSLTELVEGRCDVTDEVRQLLTHPAVERIAAGLLVDRLTVAPELEPAVAAALGGYLEAVLVEDCRAFATMLEQLPPPEGVVHFQLDSPVEALAWGEGEALTGKLGLAGRLPWLEGVYLVPSLSPYFGRSLPPGLILVTPAGERLTWRGTVRLGRGARAAGQLLQNRRRIEELRSEKARLVVVAAEQAHQLEQRRSDFERLRQQLQAAQSACHQNALQQRELEKDGQRLSEDARRLQQRAELCAFEFQQRQDEQEIARSRLEEVEQRWRLTEEACALTEDQICRQDEQWRQQRERLSHIQQQLATLQAESVRTAEREKSLLLEREREEKSHAGRQHRQQVVGDKRRQLAEDLEQTAGEAQGLKARLQVLLAHLQEEETKHQSRLQQEEQLRQALEQFEQRLRQQRSRLHELGQTLAAAELSLRQHQQDRDHLQQQVLERYQVDLAQTADAGEVEDGAEQAVQRLKKQLDEFGEVNLMAIDEYEALEKRHQFLTQQQQDLNVSIDDLQSAISQMNRTSRRRFRETFEQVNDMFRQVFPRLFVGGRAELQLTDEADLLQTGLEIVAQPPGKTLQNVMLLSGGEKALTAVALIFAIFLIKPSPFCILDEVDAPLDDANIGRFNDLIAEMAKVSQFVLITHNLRTMEIADTLFGVTMEEPGVSRLVSVRLAALVGEGG